MSSGFGATTIVSAGAPGMTDTRLYSEEHTVTQAEINQEFFYLLKEPIDAPETLLTIIGGPEQQYGPDFVVSSDSNGWKVNWTGLNLTGLIAAGDVVSVTYVIKLPPT